MKSAYVKNIVANPYVGPRAFLPGEAIYGRDDELRELFYLLAAERIVLLNSPSGAGKTSLIQAALVPRLRAADFSVLPLIRVGVEPPDDAPAANRYLISTLLSLEEALPEAQQRPLADLLALGLDAYLASRPDTAATTGSEVLIFDQFEEILTSSLADQAAKAEFFAELGIALRDRRRWALFAMREEYVAALEPLARAIPTYLSNTFRLELLDPEAAMRAIQEPARTAGVTFQADAARRLVDDLRRVTAQRSDGSAEMVLGQAIEPVQLQVVCLRLWERMPGGADLIDMAMIEEQPADGAASPGVAPASPVDRALMEYYAERVNAVSAACGVRERTVRDWCEAQLITADGLRGQVIQQQGSSAGLLNAAIGGLIDSHLLRADKRRGTTWYELAHDRLIAPIRRDNADWRARTQSLLQRQAALWERQGRPEALLIFGETLAEQEQLADLDSESLSDLDAAFLAACRAARTAAEHAAQELAAERARAARERHQLRLITTLAMIAFLAMVVALGLGFLASRNAAEAEASANQARTAESGQAAQRQTAEVSASQARTAETNADQQRAAAESAARLARSSELVVRAQNAPAQVSLILAAAAARGPLAAGETPPQAATQALITALSTVGGRELSIADMRITAYALSPDGQRLAVGTLLGDVRIYDPRATNLDNPLTTMPNVSHGTITSLAFSPDGQTLAAGLFFDATVVVYRLDDPSVPPQVRALAGSTAGTTSVAFGPGGRRLVIISDQGLWLADPANIQQATQIGAAFRVSVSAISSDGRWLVLAYQDGQIRRWDLTADPVGQGSELAGLGDTVSTLAFSPDGHWLAGGTLKGQVRRWEIAATDPATTMVILGEHGRTVNALAFSPDGRMLAIASNDTVFLWNVDQPSTAPQELRDQENGVNSVAFSPDGHWLISAGDDKMVHRWDLTTNPPVSLHMRGHEGAINSISFAASGELLVSGSDDGTLRLWNVAQPVSALPRTLDIRTCFTMDANVRSLALSPDQHTLAVGSDAGGAIIDLHAADASGSVRCLRGANTIRPLAFGGNGRWLIMGSYAVTQGSRTIALDLRDPNLGAALTVDKSEYFAVSADGNWLALTTSDGTPQIYDLRAERLGGPTWIGSAAFSGSHALALAPDGRWLAQASQAGTRLWDTQTPDANPRMLPPTAPGIAPHLLAFSPDRRWLVIAENVDELEIWDLATPDARPHSLSGTFGADTLAFSPDGRRLNVILNKTVSVWTMGADGPVAQTPWVLASMKNIISTRIWTFSPDSTWLLSGSQIWDVEARGEPLTLGGFLPTAALFSTNGDSVITGTPDGLVGIWDLRPAALADLACRTAGRGLTAAERAMYFPNQPDLPDPCLSR